MTLLRGAELTAARGALADLTARLGRARTADLSLAGGLAGLALAQATLGDAARAERSLSAAIAGLGSRPLMPGLHLGLAGVGWVAAFLLGRDADGLLAPVDAALGRMLGERSFSERFDVIHGVAGVGVYALERGAAGRALVAGVVDRLAASARRMSGGGVAWWSDPAWVSCDPEVARPANQDYSLGVAHGAPGVIALLARVVEADVAAATRRRARGLLARAVEWLLAQELSRDAEGCFAPFAAGARPARLAWCNGDPGIAAALLLAARATGDAGWRRAALRVGLRAVARGEASAGVVDAGLCHGAAGVAHAFHRLWRETGDARFPAAARRWFARALAMRGEGGFAGFRALDPDRGHRLRWQSAAGFLTGGAGVALALQGAARRDADLGWDRALLLS